MIQHTGEHIHMIGIGGAGMSPIAELLLTLGYTITGSDRIRSAAADRCELLGMAVQYHHTPLHVKKADLVVYSSAVPSENSERVYATNAGVRQIRRAEILGDLMRAHTTVCIAGTHGKTTTTSLVGTILHAAGLAPTVLVGGMLRGYGTHALIGDGTLMVAEADEYDRSFLAMYPTVAVVTNIDEDHLDCYHDVEAIRDAFVEFIGKIPFYGTLIVCSDDEGVRAVLPRCSGKIVTYGIDNPEVRFRAVDISSTGEKTEFTLVESDKQIGTVTLLLPGLHNIRNALAAIAVARLMGVNTSVLVDALATFKGVHRRFEQRTTGAGITVVDDYAHHPREIMVTLDAARKMCDAKLVAIFQPHLYSRTRDFMHDFAAALMPADMIVVTDIYRAREEPIEGVHAAGIVEQCRALGHSNVCYHADRESLVPWLREQLVAGDYAVCMGAGDITETAQRLTEVLNGTA